jgi:hypothetical protein
MSENLSNETVTISDIDAEFNAANTGVAHADFDLKVGDEHGQPLRKPREKRSAEEQAEIAAIRDRARQERLAKKLAREAAKASAPPKHSTKLERAAQNLPALDETTAELMSEVTANLPQASVVVLLAHLNHFIRVQKTTQSRDLEKLLPGTPVKIISTGMDDLRCMGKTGSVTKSQSIHVLVDVDGEEVYLYRSDVEELVEAVTHDVAVND